jgi:endonuclease YncB( thermonuclease family)
LVITRCPKLFIIFCSFLLDGYSKVVHGVEGMVDEEDKINKALVNEFAKDWVQTPFTVTNPEGRKEVVLWNPNLPFMDLGRIPDPTNISNSARELFSQSNPLIKVPIEQMKNYNYFFESPIVKDGDSQLNRVDHALNNFVLYNFGTGMAKKRGIDLGLHVMNATSGIKLLSYDYDRYKYQKLDELRKKYGDDYKPQPSLGTKALDYMDSVIAGFAGSISYATSATLDKVYESRPTKASEYTNALRPISIAKYERLSDEEKKKYIPPTNDEVMVLNKKAVELEQKELQKTGKIKRYIWTFMENKNIGDRNKEFTFGEVVHVRDGDTFDVKIGDKTETVRMLLIDTPETVQEGMIPQPGGEIASSYTKKYLLGKDTKIVFDGSHRDKYDRILGYVEIDGEDYNQKLLDEGLAKLAYIYEPYYDRLEDYKKSEEKAYQQKKGIWSIPDYANPGGYGYFNTYYDEALVRKLNELMGGKV